MKELKVVLSSSPLLIILVVVNYDINVINITLCLPYMF